jgi:hypothetical protein
MTKEEINVQYSQWCARLGEAVYRQHIAASAVQAALQEIGKLETQAREAEATETKE